MKIEVNSHTDIRGTEKYNDTLSIKRADETVQYLIDKGIEAERITSKGYGEKKLAQAEQRSCCSGGSPCA